MLYSSLGGLASLVILLLSVAQTATAGDFLSGLSAYNRGDYIRAFRDWYPLAEHGDPAAEAGLGIRSRRISHMIERGQRGEWVIVYRSDCFLPFRKLAEVPSSFQRYFRISKAGNRNGLRTARSVCDFGGVWAARACVS